jgi:hypothetical protein
MRVEAVRPKVGQPQLAITKKRTSSPVFFPVRMDYDFQKRAEVAFFRTALLDQFNAPFGRKHTGINQVDLIQPRLKKTSSESARDQTGRLGSQVASITEFCSLDSSPNHLGKQQAQSARKIHIWPNFLKLGPVQCRHVYSKANLSLAQEINQQLRRFPGNEILSFNG